MKHRLFFQVVAIAAAVFSFVSCIDEKYEISEDRLDLEVNLFEEGLAVPLGNTENIVVKDLLDEFYPEYVDYIQNIDGAYAFNMTKEFDLSDSLKNLTDMIDIPDVVFSENIEFALEDVDVSDIVIDEFKYEYSQDLSDIVEVPQISIPQLSMQHGIAAGMGDYVPENLALDLPAMSYVKSFASLAGNMNIPESFRNDTPIGISPDKLPDIFGASIDLSTGFGPEVHNVTVEVSLPKGIKSVKDIVLSENAKAVVSLQLNNSFFLSGEIVSQMDFDFHEIFSLDEAADGRLQSDFVIDAAGGTLVKEFGVKDIMINDRDWKTDAQGNMVLQKSVDIKVSGDLQYRNVTTTTNLLAGAAGKDNDITLHLEFKDFHIEDVVVELDPMTTVWEDEVAFDLPAITLPDGVNGINHITFTEGSGIDISMNVRNMIQGLDMSLEALELIFPDEMEVRGAKDGKIVLSDDDLKNGFSEKIVIRRIDLPALPTPKNGGQIAYNETVKVKAVAAIGGSLHTSDLPTKASDDLELNVSFTSDLAIDDYSVSVDGLGTTIDISEEISVKLPAEVKDMGTVVITPEGDPAIVINMEIPEVGVPVTASKQGLKISFPDMLQLGNVPSRYNYNSADNSITISGNIPSQIELPIEGLSVTPVVDPVDNECYARGSVTVTGGLSVSATDLTKDKIEALTAPGTKVSVKVEIPQLKPETLSLDSYSTSIEREFELALLEPGDVPEYLLAIERVELDNVFINMSVDASELPDLGDAEMTLDFKVDIPDMIVLAEGQQDAEGNLHISGSLDKKGKINIDPIKVEALDLMGVDLSKGVKENISVNGGIFISDVSLDVDQWLGENKKHNVKFDASIKDVVISKVSGKVDYQIDPITETIDLTGISETIAENNLDMTLDLSHVHLIAELNTNLNVTVAAGIEIVPYYGAQTGDVVTVDLDVQGDESAEVRNTRFWIGAKEECCPAGYTFKKVDVMELFNPIPDSLQVKVVGGTDPKALCTLDTSVDYVLNARCDIEVPLQFGDDLKVEFSDTLEIDSETIGLILAASDLAVTGTVESSLPMNLNLEASLLDKNNKEIQFDEGSGVLNILGSADGSPVTTDIDLRFVKKEGAALPEINAIRLVFSLQSAADGARLTPDAYIKATLQALVPKGVNVDLKDFINKEEE